MIENETTEFKREYIDEIKKTIIAFANCGGGNIYIGVNNDGTVCGVSDVDECQLRVVNLMHDTIKPDVLMFANVTVEVEEGKQLIRIEVSHGTGYPYYLASKGIRPEGVFVRKGACTVPASSTEILKMIKEASGDNFEAERSLNQQLTFKTADEYFSNRNAAFGEEQKRTLGIISSDGIFTNLGLLLSDQCSHTIKFAVFEGTSKTLFKDRKEFGGSLFKQLEDAYSAIQMFNHLQSDFAGLQRIDHYDYPTQAIREALLNAVVHREYSFTASTLISIYYDRIEIVTIGGLVKGISKSDIMLGISVPRNRNLANIFYRLHLIEAYGTGILKIKECYRGNTVQPMIEISENAFKVTLPNINFNNTTEKQSDEPVSLREEKIIDYIKGNKFITRSVVQEMTGCSQTTAIKTLKELAHKGIIEKSGNGAKTKYKLSASCKLKYIGEK